MRVDCYVAIEANLTIISLQSIDLAVGSRFRA